MSRLPFLKKVIIVLIFMNNCGARKAATDAVVALFRQSAQNSEALREAEANRKEEEDKKVELKGEQVESKDEVGELEDENTTEVTSDKLEGD